MLFDNPMFGKVAHFSTQKCLTVQMGPLPSDAVENASFGQNKKLGIGNFLYTIIFSVKICNPSADSNPSEESNWMVDSYVYT